MAYYSGFQGSAFQRNAYQINGSSSPASSGGYIPQLGHAKHRWNSLTQVMPYEPKVEIEKPKVKSKKRPKEIEVKTLADLPQLYQMSVGERLLVDAKNDIIKEKIKAIARQESMRIQQQDDDSILLLLSM